MSSDSQDASFEDAPMAARPLRLKAESAEDLAILSSLVQDAVGRVGDIGWLPRHHRLVLLLNRFRWENGVSAGPSGGALERVRSAISVDGVLGVRARGLDPADKARIYDLLAILFEPGAEGAGTLVLTLAGGAEIAAEVECLDLALADLTRPWPAKAPKAPAHGS